MHQKKQMADEAQRLRPGQLVLVQSLKSDFGRIMNGQPGIIVRYVPQHGRYEVLTPSPNENPTVALKPENVRAVPRRLPIPQKQERGCVFDPEVGMMNVLAELLVRKTDEYTPSDTMLQGYAAMALQQIDMDDRMNLGCLDMEQCAGILAMARVCLEGEDMAAEECVAVLLQRESMHLDVITLLITQTPYFGPPEDKKSNTEWADVESDWNCSRYYAPDDAFTPDQTHSSYCKFMSLGPLLFLKEMSKYDFCSPLFAEIQRVKWYHLLLRRFLRIIAREVEGAFDGKALGKLCRQIFPHLVSRFDDDGDKIYLVPRDVLKKMQEAPVSEDISSNILEKVNSVLGEEGSASEDNLRALLLCEESIYDEID